MEEWSQKQGTEDHLSGRWLKETNYAKGGGWQKRTTMDPGGTSREEVI